MPVATFRARDLCRLAGVQMDAKALGEALAPIGGDVDKAEGDQLAMEWFPNRPDLLCIEASAAALAAFTGRRPGLPQVPVRKGQQVLHVDASVASVRPHAALCFVRGVRLDEDAVAGLIEAQEKLCLGMGRRRRKVAIGLHDASGRTGPFHYTAVGPRDKPFVPLGESREMTPAQVLAQHPKGREYAGLLPADRFPVFLDGAGHVLSMPPVINAAATAVAPATRDILVDVTGTEPTAVRRTAALLAFALAQRGGVVETVRVHDASGAWDCPDLRPVERTLHVDDVAALLGARLEAEACAQALRRMGHDAEGFDNKVLVQSPPWRFDLLHDVDWLEDVAVGVGFDAIPGGRVTVPTFGSALPHQPLEDRLRMLLIGHGWLEARTLTLTDPAADALAWGADPEPAAQVLNPVLQEQTQLRTRLLPSLLQVLAQNKHRPLPQRLFEVGHVVRRHADGAFRNELRLAVVELSAKAGFSEAKAVAQALERDARLGVTLGAEHVPGFIPGRCGVLRRAGAQVGHFGELHPATLSAFGLGAPGWGYELSLA
ncbi:MAG TPA: phenylalanine--tRNA ligase subunit beta [Candidatus Thermoplasmatota archaeon]|nr:phenylalanine--tRNA ligase subunit beta [Candidatus Thermoplasmatota archaeon]